MAAVEVNLDRLQRFAQYARMAIHKGFFPKGDCSCNAQCPGPDILDCTCTWIASTGQCTCLCDHAPVPQHEGVQLALDTPIAIDTRGDVTVARLAEILASISGQKLLIPAARSGEKLSIKESYTTIAEVVESLGLTVDDSK